MDMEKLISLDAVLGTLSPEERARVEERAAEAFREVHAAVELNQHIASLLGLTDLERAELVGLTDPRVTEGRSPRLMTLKRLVEEKGGKVSLNITTSNGEEHRLL